MTTSFSCDALNAESLSRSSSRHSEDPWISPPGSGRGGGAGRRGGDDAASVSVWLARTEPPDWRRGSGPRCDRRR